MSQTGDYKLWFDFSNRSYPVFQFYVFLVTFLATPHKYVILFIRRVEPSFVVCCVLH